MISNTIPITGHVVGKTTHKRMSGKATVEARLDSGLYVLRRGTETLTVQTNSPALKPGMNVVVTTSTDQMVSIKPLPDTPGKADEFIVSPSTQGEVSVRDLADAIRDTAKAIEQTELNPAAIEKLHHIRSALVSTRFPELTEKVVNDCIRSITTLLETPPDRVSQQQLRDMAVLLRESAVAVDHEYNTARATAHPYLLTTQFEEGFIVFSSRTEAQQWLETFGHTNGRMRHRLFRIPDSGPVYIRTFPGQNDGVRAMVLNPGKVLAELRHVLDHTLQHPIWKKLPAEGLMEVLQDRGILSLRSLEHIDTLLRADPGTSLPAPETTHASPAFVRCLQQWINIALDTLGMSHAAAQSPPHTSLAGLPDLYAALRLSAPTTITSTHNPIDHLEEYNHIRTGKREAAVLIPEIMKRTGYTFENDLLRAAGNNDALPHSMKADLLRWLGEAKFSRPEKGDVSTPVRETQEQKVLISKVSTDTPVSIARNIQRELSTLLETLRHETPALSSGKETRDQVARCINRLHLLHQLFSDVTFSGAGTTEGNTSFGELLRKLQQTLQDLLQHIQSQTNGAATQSAHTATPNQEDTPAGRLGILLRHFEAFVREQADAAHRLTDTAEGETARSMGLQRIPAESFREAVENALRRIDSHQLLARPTSTTQGTQTLIALPMKIGKEWVDVSLRFIKRQSPHKKKTGNPRYTVRIDVSPTTTGSIGVSMDYHTSGLLKLHLLFEKSGAKRWFDNNANEVRDALCGNDITSCTLDTALLNNAADTAPVFKDSPRRERNGGFDIIG